MKTFEKLINIQKINNSRLCISLDPQIEKLPKIFPRTLNGILYFNQKIIDKTKDYVCAYKLNFAFYEQYGSKGIEILEKTLELIPKTLVTIADGKRADIGNTSKAYAKSIFEHFRFDCATLNPYLGIDSLRPFFEYEDKLNFVLVCTSNPGASDFQKLLIKDKYLFEEVLEKFSNNFPIENLGFVVGATNESEFAKVRGFAPNNFILVPGIGAQGGNLEAILRANNHKNLIINVGRDIIYASSEDDFEEKVREKTLDYWQFLKIERL